MALDILTSDLVVDETSGLTDDDINPSIAPYLTNTTVQHLLGLDALGGLGSPAFAVKADFVVASAACLRRTWTMQANFCRSNK